MIAALVHRNVHQLHRRAIRAHARVQRRRVNGRQDRIDAVAHRAAHEIFGDPPVFLRENLHLVISGQAIGVEPFGVNQRLLRQLCVDHAHRKRRRTERFARVLVQQSNRNRVFAGLHRVVRVKIEPDRLPHARNRANAVRRNVDQRVGIQPRRAVFQVIVVRVRELADANRHVFHAPCAQMPGNRRIDLHFQPRARVVLRAFGPKRELERNDLVAHALKRHVRRLRRAIREHLGQWGKDSHFKHNSSSSVYKNALGAFESKASPRNSAMLT